jgi:AraC-like DNA-binding protein
MNDGADAQLSVRGREARLRYVGPASRPMPRAYVEFVLATWVRFARETTDDAAVIDAMHVPHPPPRDLRPYRDVLGVPMVFGSRHPELRLRADILARPLLGADLRLTEVLERHAETVLAARAPADEWRRRVTEVLRTQLADGSPRLATIARALAMSERALRRRLESEGTTFVAVVDDLRRALALDMVGDASLSIAEVAFLLGFSEPSAFHRAFRRWTGRTPRG